MLYADFVKRSGFLEREVHSFWRLPDSYTKRYTEKSSEGVSRIV